MFQIRMVIFDMDGLMFDTERIAVDAWHSAGAQLGYEITPSMVMETIGLDRKNTEAVLVGRLGPSFPYWEARRLRTEYANEIIRKQGVPVKEGLYDLLDCLDRKQIKKAVATSTERTRAQRLMDLAGVGDRFDVVICGDEVARGKPFPDIFLAATRRLNMDPGECCSVGGFRERPSRRAARRNAARFDSRPGQAIRRGEIVSI